MWIADSLAPVDDPQYNVAVWQRVQGDIDIDVMRACFERMLARNDNYALRFDEQDGQPYQWVDPAPAHVEIVDFSAAADPARACADWRDRDCVRPFALRDARMYRAAILRESPSVVYLYLNAHHLVTDGSTHSLALVQVWFDYEHVLRTGEPLELTPPSYLAAVRSDLEYRAGAEHRGDIEYFRSVLAGSTPALFSRSRDRRTGTEHSLRSSFTVPAEHSAAMREIAGSPFAFVAAVLATCLSRIHDSGDIVLGVPFANRHTDRDRMTAGLFVTELPFRVAVRGAASTRELAAEARTTTKALRGHERLSTGDLLHSLSELGDGTRQLFDVTLSYTRFTPPVAPVPDLRLEVGNRMQLRAQEALSIQLISHDDTGELEFDLDYAPDVFDEDFPIESFTEYLRNLLRDAVERPDAPVSELTMLTPADHTELLRLGRGAPVELTGAHTLHDLFERQAGRTPDRIAIADDRSPITYADLSARADRVAGALRSAGVRPDDRVAVLLGRSPDMLAAVLGVLRAGAAYVPVDPGYPADRIRFLLEDSGARIALSQRGFPLPPGPHVLYVDELPDGIGTRPQPKATDRNLAYVIYTSGSTGRPKGVMVEHRSVINRLAWMQRRFPIGPGDIVLQKTPISFDVSVWELFWWALEGATVALLPPGGEKDPEVIARTIAEQRCSVVHFVPSMFGPFLELLESAPELREALTALRLVFCSGEALPPARVAQFGRIFGTGAVELVNLYGPTEATVDVTYYRCPTDSAAVDRVPIGRPIDNIRLYVLDAERRLQPVGVPGELYIGGVGVARGYLGRPELTEERFVADPFVPGERLFRSGDRVRWLADGNLEYLGRLDDQVKIRGNRVELGEVGNALAEVPGIRDAIVLDHSSAGRGTYLVGYYLADSAADSVTIRDELAKTLPDYMIPARFVRIDRIPLTANGKADRRALRPLDTGEVTTGHRTAPRTTTEAVLAEIWSEVLGVENVGVHDDYFALGGDSMLMLPIRARAQQHGIRFALEDLVRHPTVAGVATTATVGADTSLAPFELVSQVDRAALASAADAFPLTRLQLGMLYYSRAQEDSATYHDVFRYTLSMPWDERAFRHAFDRLVIRHPALRSSLNLSDFSEPLQVVHHSAPGGLDIADLRDGDAETARATIAEHVEHRRTHRYRFEHAPLSLLQVLLCPDTVELVLSFHHAILDGGSVATLIGELLQDYAHGLGLRIDPVAQRALPSAAEYVLAERTALEDPAQQQFWRDRLAGAVPTLPAAFAAHTAPGPDDPITRIAALPDELAEAVRRFARTHAVPMKSVLFAAHCAALGLFGGATDITTGLITHGRPELADAERMSGLFLNTVPMRLSVDTPNWLELVREAQRCEQHSFPYRRYPLSAIQRDLGSSVLDTGFNYVHFRQLATVLGLAEISMLDFHTWEETNLALLVNTFTHPADGRIWFRIDCRGTVFTPAQADVYLDDLFAIVRRIVDEPYEPPSVAFLAATAAPTVAPDRTPADIVSAVRAQIARTPSATAVALDDRRYTYAELGRAADRVARHLISQGCRLGDTVGIAMPRSPETIAVLLGVLAAGVAAVPLDVTYPRRRIAAVLAQAEPFRVITTAEHAPLLQGECILLAEDLLGAQAADAPLPEIISESTAYVLFTSGSTGQPKGVAMPHRALANLVAWQNDTAGAALGGVTAQYAPLGFDVSFQEIFATLRGGGTLALIPDAERRDAAALLRRLDRDGVTRLYLPYVALQQLAETAVALDTFPRSLRVLISSGEKLLVTDAIRQLCTRLPGVLLENQYGPTETHVATSYSMTGDPARFPALPPIGRAIDGASIHVLDSRLRPVPVGGQGEIYLGGVCPADGYLNQPELTAERFLPDPFGAPGERLYRTGDLGLVLPDGSVATVGRADTQVKVRGFRVEPAEIELAITGIEGTGISDAAVVVRNRTDTDSYLVAFLVGDPQRTHLDGLRSKLRAQLPEYLVPTHFQWLPSLPLTPSGKRDDAALRRIPLTPDSARDATAPRDEYEHAIAEIVADQLQLPQIGVEDDIFDRGATSLTAMRLVASIERRYGVAIALSEFVVAPTVAALAARLRDSGAASSFDPLVPIRADGRGRPVYFVHPLGGNVLCYVPLARRLGSDRPFYGVQAPGAALGTEPLSSVPELAAYYLEAIRRVQPEGPYTLGGWSFGGIVAFEMARLLHDAGERVDEFIVLDSVVLDPARRAQLSADEEAETLLRYFVWELLLLRRGGDSPLETIPAHLTTLDEKFEYVAELAVREGVLPPGSNETVIRRLFDVYAAHACAVVNYRPAPADVDLTLIHAAEPLPEVLETMHRVGGTKFDDPANGWGELITGRLKIIDVPGNHLTIVEEPRVAHVATIVTDLIGA
ncbi:amino acid adenylation domain-containing protein [Nocardia transvalensis]|nr:amino acid adenylation domain-containing protein [Nocardia transvalensis]